MAKGGSDDDGIRGKVNEILACTYAHAERLVKESGVEAFAREKLDAGLAEKVLALKDIHHNGRGLTLLFAALKAARPKQDIRAYQKLHPGGCDARGLEGATLVPFLGAHKLHTATESHFLTRRFADGEPYSRTRPIRTKPPLPGTLFLDLVCSMQEAPETASAEAIACVLLAGMIQERNKGDAVLAHPKNVTIQGALGFLRQHINFAFDKPRDAGPRLAQIALFAIYECVLGTSKRYQGHKLGSLERLKAANRKSGTVGDIDVLLDGKPIEAVEVKFGEPITLAMVDVAIEKIESKDVRRYYILSTAGVSEPDGEKIAQRCKDFYHNYGCEIIVNGVLETIGYYLRLIGSTDEFIARYVEYVAKDKDLTFEHKQAWNAVTRPSIAG
jgi:DNA (cytosine-5)-methyltransferase 1